MITRDMFNIVLLYLLSLALTAFAIGCDSRSPVIDCPLIACGANAAQPARLPISELHLYPGQNTG